MQDVIIEAVELLAVWSLYTGVDMVDCLLVTLYQVPFAALLMVVTMARRCLIVLCHTWCDPSWPQATKLVSQWALVCLTH